MFNNRNCICRLLLLKVIKPLMNNYHILYATFVKGFEITRQFSDSLAKNMIIRNYVKQTEEFFTRITRKISVITIRQYMNKINNKPIGQIKYALT